MKKLLITIIILIILAAGVLGFALLNANKLIAQFKPQLENLVSQLVGAQIELQNISATVLPETALKVSGLTIKNKSGKAESEPGPAFDEFYLSLNLKSLLERKLDITKVSLVAPKITLLKSASGIRLQGLPVKQEDPQNKPNPTVEKAAQGNDKAESASDLSKMPLPINLESFELKNGSIILQDQVTNKSYTISDFNVAADLNIAGDIITTSNLKVSGKALDKFPVNLSVPKILLSNKDVTIETFSATLAEIALQGAAKINLKSQKGDIAISSAGIDFDKVLPLAANFVPKLNELALKGTLIPDVKIKLQGNNSILADGSIGLSGIGAQQGNFTVSNLKGNIAFKAQGPKDLQASSEDLKLDLNNQAVSLKFLAKLIGDILNLENLSLNLLGGSVNGNVNLGLDDAKTFSTKLQGNSINIENALALIKADPANLSGLVDNFNANITGHLGSDLKESLRGNANFKLSNGEIKGWNLPGLVLKAVNNLPFLTGALYSSVPDSQRSTIDSNNTAFNALTGNISFIGSGINANEIKLTAPVFSLDANGKVGFDSSLDLASTIIFNKNFSSTLVERVPQLKNVLDDQEQLVIPLKLQGKPPLVIVYPNVKKLAEVAGKRVIINKAGDAVKGILEKKGLGGIGGLLGF